MPDIGVCQVAFGTVRRPPSVAMIVGTTPMIAIPVAAFMGLVAMIVGPAPQIRCNDFGHGRPMIAIPAANDCGSLQLWMRNALNSLDYSLSVGFSTSSAMMTPFQR
jgi:hypothetical protein